MSQTVTKLRYVPWTSSEEDVRIKSVNIVDEASIFAMHLSVELLLQQYRQWTRAYERQRWLKVDASRTNLGETLQRALEADGTELLDVPGEADEQVGRVEVHGRYFEDTLARVLAHGPSGLNASTRPRKPRTLSQEGAVTALSR